MQCIEHLREEERSVLEELRTRIIQEMKAQYGDDYARIIKLYFEQIADNKPPK